MHTKTFAWPAFIITLALAFLAFTWWSLERAASGASPVSDPNYYRHGLQYNLECRELQAAEALSWVVSPRLAGRRLSVRVEDAAGVDIPGCRVQITFPSEAQERPPALPTLALTDAGEGLYTMELPTSLPATTRAILTLSKGQATMQRRLLLSITP